MTQEEMPPREMLDRFVTDYINGEQGCSMESDDAQAMAIAIVGLRRTLSRIALADTDGMSVDDCVRAATEHVN